MEKSYSQLLVGMIVNSLSIAKSRILWLGLVVLQKNYLLVYPYDKWVGHKLPDFEQGEEFQPTICELRNGQTTKPSFLTEADLVTLMDKNGIGSYPLKLAFYSRAFACRDRCHDSTAYPNNY